MDPATSTLIGASIGGLIGLGTSWLNSYFSSNREATQWQRQRDAELETIKRSEEKIEKNELRKRKEELREIYLNSIQHLSTLCARDEGEDGNDSKIKITGEDRVQLIKDTHKWLAQLALRNLDDIDSDFNDALERFTKYPDSASDLREEVIKLAQADQDLTII